VGGGQAYSLSLYKADEQQTETEEEEDNNQKPNIYTHTRKYKKIQKKKNGRKKNQVGAAASKTSTDPTQR
jgi:hypothetical protein